MEILKNGRAIISAKETEVSLRVEKSMATQISIKYNNSPNQTQQYQRDSKCSFNKEIQPRR